MSEPNAVVITEQPAPPRPPALAEVVLDSSVGVNLKSGELPNQLAPGVSRWMTWGFLGLIFAVPVIQSGLEIKRGSYPQVLKLFTRTPSRRNLEAFEKRLEENSFAKQYIQPRMQAALKGPANAGAQTAQQAATAQTKTVQANVTGGKTPFIQWLDGTGGGLVLHPFIDFTKASGPPESQLDYFGFRNPVNYYFTRPKGKLIVLTGNSEAMGSTHQRPIALRLEDYLNSHSNEKWHVFSLAMNGYTVPTEINAYIHLAYHLRPDVVISHSLGSDMFFGLMVPTEYKTLGLYYYKPVETWYPQVRGITVQGAGRWEHVEGGEDLLADGYLRNARKYRDIVEQNGGHFLLGLQKCDPEAGPKVPPEQRKAWRVVARLYRDVQAKMPAQKLDYTDFAHVDGLKCVDPIHTTDESAQIIAETYAARILRRVAEKNAADGAVSVTDSPR